MFLVLALCRPPCFRHDYCTAWRETLAQSSCVGVCTNSGPAPSHAQFLRCRGLQGRACLAQISRDAAYLTACPIIVACPSPQNDPRVRTAGSLSRSMQTSVTRPTPPVNLVRPCTTHHNHRWILPLACARKSLDDATVGEIPRCYGWMRKSIDKRHPGVEYSVRFAG